MKAMKPFAICTPMLFASCYSRHAIRVAVAISPAVCNDQIKVGNYWDACCCLFHCNPALDVYARASWYGLSICVSCMVHIPLRDSSCLAAASSILPCPATSYKQTNQQANVHRPQWITSRRSKGQGEKAEKACSAKNTGGNGNEDDPSLACYDGKNTQKECEAVNKKDTVCVWETNVNAYCMIWALCSGRPELETEDSCTAKRGCSWLVVH